MVRRSGDNFAGYDLEVRLGGLADLELWRARDEAGAQVLLRVEADPGSDAPTTAAGGLEVVASGTHDGHGYVVHPGHDGLPLIAALERGRGYGVWPDPYVAGYIVLEVLEALAAPVMLTGLHVFLGTDGRVRVSAPSRPAHDRDLVVMLGGMLWELLTGRIVPPGPLPSLPAAVPEQLGRVAQRALSDPAEGGFERPSGLVDALHSVLDGHPKANPEELARLVAQLVGPAPGRPRTAMIDGGEGPAPVQAREATAEPDLELDHPRFAPLGQLGAGAMGAVLRVHDLELDEVVALKVIENDGGASRRSLERLRREVRLARRIANPHVCRIFDIVDLGDGRRGLTMEVIEGYTLSELMFEARGDYLRAASWGADIADGLAAAHGLDIVHRDLKPENIMIRADDGRAVILDFGIARAPEETAASPNLTQAGVLMGTPMYMAPEQLVGEPIDGRSDLYSLGLILAEIVTGQVPLYGPDYQALVGQRVRPDATYSLRDVDPDAPSPFAAVVDQMLSVRRAQRPAAAGHVRDELRTLARTLRIMANPPLVPPPPQMPPPEAEPTPPAKQGLATRVQFAVIAVLVVVAAMAAGALYRQQRSRGAADAGSIAVDAATVVAPSPDAGVVEDAEVTPVDAGERPAVPDAGRRRRPRRRDASNEPIPM